MKNNYFTIDTSISPEENMKKLVNHIFQKEISLDILRGTPPNYSNLRINNISFKFLNSSFYVTCDESNTIRYLQLFFYFHKIKHNHRKESVKIIEQKINITYLRKVFNNFKSLKEVNEELYLADLNQQKENTEKINKIKNRNGIKYPSASLYFQDSGFQLTLHNLTEDKVDILMTYWNKINKNENQ